MYKTLFCFIIVVLFMDVILFFLIDLLSRLILDAFHRTAQYDQDRIVAMKNQFQHDVTEGYYAMVSISECIVVLHIITAILFKN